MAELTDRELSFGYWFFLHRATLRRGLIGLFIVAIAAMWSYTGWQLVDWLAGRRADEESIRLLVASTVNTQDYFKRHQPLPLEVGTATAVPSGNGRYDLLAEVKNPNPTWGMRTVDYAFTASGQTFTGSSFLLPFEDTYLMVLGADLPTRPAEVSFTTTHVAWERIRSLSNFTPPTFSVANQKLEQLSALSPGSAPAARLRLDLTNDSASSFWHMEVAVVLLSGNVPQAVGRQSLGEVDSGHTYPVEFSWPRGVPPVDRVVVKPKVNIFDSGVVKAVE